MYQEQGNPNLAFVNAQQLPIAYWQRKLILRNALSRLANASNIIFELFTVGLFIGTLLYSASIYQQIRYLPSNSIHKNECTVSSVL